MENTDKPGTHNNVDGFQKKNYTGWKKPSPEVYTTGDFTYIGFLWWAGMRSGQWTILHLACCSSYVKLHRAKYTSVCLQNYELWIKLMNPLDATFRLRSIKSTPGHRLQLLSGVWGPGFHLFTIRKMKKEYIVKIINTQASLLRLWDLSILFLKCCLTLLISNKEV